MNLNSGKAWSPWDLYELEACLELHDTTAEIAESLRRDEDKVVAKMAELGLVERTTEPPRPRAIAARGRARRGARRRPPVL